MSEEKEVYCCCLERAGDNDNCEIHRGGPVDVGVKPLNRDELGPVERGLHLWAYASPHDARRLCATIRQVWHENDALQARVDDLEAQLAGRQTQRGVVVPVVVCGEEQPAS